MKRTRVNPVSPKRRAHNATGAMTEAWEAVWTRSRGRCEFPDCTGPMHHAHHIGRRWHGNDAPDNLAALCTTHHDWCHANVAKAEDMGLLRRSGALPPVTNTKANR